LLARSIELLVLDVDGVLTDGKITYCSCGEEIKSFNSKDGAGMKYWKRTGKKLAIISGRSSQSIVRRAEELQVDAVELDRKDKLEAYRRVLSVLRIGEEATAAIGDDLTDLPILMHCAFPVAVADSPEEVKSAAAYITSLPGGSGCVRETIELILKRAGQWEQVISRYLEEPCEQGGSERPK